MADASADAGMPSLGDIMGKFVDFTGQLVGLGNQVAGVQAQARQATTSQDAGIQQQSTGEQTVNTIKGANAAATEAANESAATDFGVNKDASSYVITAMGQGILAREKDIIAQRDDIAKRQSVGIFDDPLEWISNQILLPGKIDKANTDIGTINQMLDTVKGLQDRTTQQAVVNSAINNKGALEQATALNQEVAGAAQQKVAMSQLELAKLNMTGISVSNAIDKSSFDAIYQYNTAAVQRQELALNVVRTKAEVGEYEQRAALQAMQVQADQNNLEAQAGIVARVNKAAIFLNLNPYPSYAAYKADTAPKRALLDSVAGSQAMDAGSIGFYPAQVAETLTNNNARMPGLQESTVGYLRNQIATTINNNDTKAAAGMAAQWKAYGPADQFNKANNDIYADVKKTLGNIPQQGTIYSPPTMGALIASSPALANLPLVQKTGLAAIASNPNQILDADLVMKNAMLMVAAGANSQDVANQVATLYKGAQMVNDQMYAYGKFALPNLTGHEYNQIVQGSGGVTNRPRVVDLTNGADINNFINRAMSASKVRELMTNPLGPAPYSPGG